MYLLLQQFSIGLFNPSIKYSLLDSDVLITNPDLILFKRPLGLLFSSVKANSFKNTLSKKPLSIAGTLLNHSGNTNIISSLSFKCFWYFFD